MHKRKLNPNYSPLMPIHMVNNRGFIWTATDWYVLRTTHRLLGSLVGALSSAPRQDDQNGLPCILLPEEVRLLVEKGICRPVEYPLFTSLPIHGHEIVRKLRHNHQLLKFKTRYALKKADSISKLVVQTILADGDETSKEVLELNREVKKIKPLDISKYTIIHRDECSPVVKGLKLPEFKSDLERIRYKVFKDLWSKGYYLTCGMKFGGDFLVYEGDPLAHHASYIVNCRDVDKQLIVSRSRVGSITKKKMILAKDDGDSIKYLVYSLED